MFDHVISRHNGSDKLGKRELHCGPVCLMKNSSWFNIAWHPTLFLTGDIKENGPYTTLWESNRMSLNISGLSDSICTNSRDYYDHRYALFVTITAVHTIICWMSSLINSDYCMDCSYGKSFIKSHGPVSPLFLTGHVDCAAIRLIHASELGTVHSHQLLCRD